MLWGLMNDLSSITILSLLAIPVPGIAQTLLGYVLSFTQLDVLPSDVIFNSFLKFGDANKEPISDFFDNAGFSSKNALNNMGSTAIFIALNIFLLLVITFSNMFG